MESNADRFRFVGWPEPRQVALETDCEDQGFSLISEGCFRCLPTFVDGKPVRQPLERFARLGRWYWRCPKCEGYYGECSESDAESKHG